MRREFVRTGVAALLALAWFGHAPAASAYRPFDGTDADVADAGEFELELGPTQFYGLSGARYLLAPAMVLNLGIVPNVEAVVEGTQVIANHAPSDEARVRVLDTEVLLKSVLRQGVLQERSGPSIALEAGLLLPEARGDKGFGAQLTWIQSFQGKLGALHLNEAAERTRDGHWVVLGSVILEAPATLAVRPVAELLAEHELGANGTYSALVGAIWTATDALSVDGALRLAREDETRAVEVRFGFSWAVSIWRSRTVTGKLEPRSVSHAGCW